MAGILEKSKGSFLLADEISLSVLSPMGFISRETCNGLNPVTALAESYIFFMDCYLSRHLQKFIFLLQFKI